MAVHVQKKLKPIPKFESEDQEREFWANHDSTEYVDWSRAKPILPIEEEDDTARQESAPM
jgi:hypothetical protein